MKKLMFALVTAALLNGPTTKAAYIGTFTAGGSYSFEISATSNVEWVVTFMSVVRGRPQVDNMITGNGNFPPTNIPVPTRAERIILLVDTRGGSALVRLINGGVPREVIISEPPGEARVVADVVP